MFALFLVIVVTPFVFDPASRDAFRLPKALFAQTAILASLFLLALGWRDPEVYRRLLRSEALRAVGPLVLFGTAISLLSRHPEHVHRALVGFWIGFAALWGWSVGFRRGQLARALDWMTWPAALLAAVAILQFHDLFQPFRFETLAQSSRLAITSFAGNAGDLAAFLVLPALVAQRAIARKGFAVWPAAVLALSFYGIAITQTFAALSALAVGSAVLWWPVLPVRRRVLALSAFVATVLLALAVAAPFRARAERKVTALVQGDWNRVLTGRLDGWRTGAWMLSEHPFAGVGLGAYRAEFVRAKQALLDRGVPFFPEQGNVVFANAHNEVIEVGAELGIGGLLLLAWAVVEIVKRTRSLERGEEGREALADRGFAWAALAALVVLSLSHFPFRIALVSSQAFLLLAWIFAREEST